MTAGMAWRLAAAAVVALAAVGVVEVGVVEVGGALAQTQQFQPRDESETSYPDHPGRAETFGLCASCHGFRIVAAQGMTRPQWNESINWMIQRHNMPVIDPEHRGLILDYLVKAFPPQAPAGGRPGWRNPFAPAP